MTFRMFLLIVAVIGLVQDTPRHDKYAEDEKAYCFNPATSGSLGPTRARDPHAHTCACHLICKRDASGAVYDDQEDSTCELYCTRAR